MNAQSCGMLKKVLSALMLAVFVAGTVHAAPMKLECPKEIEATRPPVMFDHDRHNEKAGIKECAICHHGKKEEQQEPGKASEAVSCVNCHAVNGKEGKTPYARAFHRQCILCHARIDKGPTACGECHKQPARLFHKNP